eukprot:CFRG3636T1
MHPKSSNRGGVSVRGRGRGEGSGMRGRGGRGRGGTRGRGRGTQMGIEKFAFGKTSTYKRNENERVLEAAKNKRAAVTSYKRMLKREGLDSALFSEGNRNMDDAKRIMHDEREASTVIEAEADQSAGSDDESAIVDKQSDQGEDGTNIAGERQKRKVYDPKAKKSDPFAKQRKIALANKLAKEAEKKRKDDEIAALAKKKNQMTRTRENRTKRLTAVTPKGQPVLRNHMRDILTKLQNEKHQKKKSKR